MCLCELLLDKEGPQVRQLPGARNTQHSKLDQDPADDACVGALGLVAKLGLAFLFTSHISLYLPSPTPTCSGVWGQA